MLEESLTMESPDRIRPIAGATETQASPLFTYLCSLSPIKAVKSFHVPQTFLELSFPPPPTVFVSPNGDHKTTGTCRRRGVGRIGGEAIRCIRENGKGNTHSVKKQSEGGIGTSLIKEECDHSHHGNDFVEQYLADPVETEERESPLELVRFDTSVEMNNEESKEEHKGFTSMSSEAARVASDLNSRSFASGHQGVVKIVGRKRVGTFVVPSDKTIQTNKEEDRTIQTDIIDQSVSDFSVLLRGTADELSELQLASAVPYPQVSGFLATMREIFNEDLEGSQTNLQELSCDCKSELVLEVKEEEADMEASVDNQVSNGNHRGVRRRCLDFEAAKMHRKNFSTLATATTSTTTTTVQGSLSNAEAQSKISPSNQATADITLSDSPQGLGKIDEEHRALIEVLTPNMLSWRHSHADSHNTGESLDRCNNSLVCTSPLSVGMPSGIGLHLNSLAGALSHSRESLFHSRESLLHSRENTCGDSLLRKPAKGVNNLLSVDSVGIGSSPNFGQDLVVSLFEKARMDRHEVDGSAQIGGTAELTTCFGSVTLSGINRLDGNAQLGEAEKTFSPLGRKRVLLQDFCKQSDLDASDDSGQSSLSPKKKRKLPSGGEKSSDGCKRCNCKKSKCLKLYCECFAAGVYCVDSCSCRECFNKPEFEETVLGTRQQIESRNPLAFAPKIVRDDSSPTIVDEVGKTPASGRHKRGCNCKRSMCLKKYCECYQAGVGCSDSCRCEGCKNLHGRKEGSEEFDGKGCEEGLIETHAAEDQASLLLPEAEGVVADSNKNQSSNLSPVTPFQQPGRMRSSAKPGCEGIEEQFLLEKRPPSPQRLLLHCSSSKGDRDGTGVSLKVAMSPTMDDYCIGGQLLGGWGGEEMCAILLTPPLLPPRPKSLHPSTDFMEQVDTHQSSRITTETMPPIGTRTRKFLLQHTISSSLPPC